MEEAYRKFRSSAQPAVRLEIALDQAFQQNLPEGAEQAYGAYLKTRIRPAVEQCILREDTDLLDQLAEKGWMEGLPLDDFLKLAGEHGKNESFIWLLRRKKEKFGFHRPDFSL